MKLYSSNKAADIEIGTIINLTGTSAVNNDTNIAEGLVSLEKHVTAYGSLSTVYGHVVTEEFSFVNRSNCFLYNEYIRTITSNLGLPDTQSISQEAINLLPTAALNHHLALEGFISGLWEKIKKIFASIIKAIKDFFIRYFTRLGKLKGKLQNLKELLNSTEDNLKTPSLDTVPSGLASKYPYGDSLTINTITDVFKNSATTIEALTKINTDSIKLAKKDVLDADFVEKVKSLKNIVDSGSRSIDANNDRKNTGFKSKIPGTDAHKENKAIDEDNKGIKQTVDEAKKAADSEGDKLDVINNDKENINIEFDDKDFIAAKNEFSALLDTINTSMGSLLNKKLISGKTITKITVTPEDGINLELETNEDKPTSVSLSGKNILSTLVDNTIKTITDSEEVASKSGSVNDAISKSMTSIDKLITDIDSIGDAKLGKYKAILNNKVKERLSLLKTFFTTYNKLNKTLFETVLDAADGNVEYTVLCIKYFGR